MTPEGEFVILSREAARHGVDPLFLLAIRRAEAGGPGREMGVVSVEAPEFEDQASVAAKTVRNRLAEYDGNPFTREYTSAPDRAKRLCYSQRFIRWFAERWAPIGAGNDPGGLNRHWAENVIRIYWLLVGASNAPDPPRATA